MELILILAGIAINVGITVIVFRSFFVGSLRIDNSDQDDGPYIFLELEKGIGDISSKKYVILRIKRKNYLSHK